MILGAVVTHFWVPDVQEKVAGKPHGILGGNTKTLTLEVLGKGRSGPRSLPVAMRQRPVGLGDGRALGLEWT